MEAVLSVSIINYVTKGAREVSRYKTHVTTQRRKAVGRWRVKALVIGKVIVSIMPLIVLLLSCSQSNMRSPDSWSIYRNSRYSFEFPYPSNWIAFPMPDNRDGRAFRDPQNPNIEIRGWAANNLAESNAPSQAQERTPKQPQSSQQQNFTTDQGLTGKLRVELGSDLSLMTLSLSQGNVLYSWQGQSESEQFADYYRFFNYVARQYRLPVSE